MTLDELLACLKNRSPVQLGHLPTPLEPLPRLSAKLKGPDLWVKRDDQTGLATGGNKVRKLNFLMADALAHKADLVMTTGAQQSNHARQTAAAAARLGIPCTLVLRGEGAPSQPQGNYLLDRLLGAEIKWAGQRSIMEALDQESRALRDAGYRPYVVPYGGSNAVGVCGYVAAMAELWQQMISQKIQIDTIVIASSSGGTQAGLLLGARVLGYAGRIIGVSIAERASEFQAHIAALANETASLLGVDIRLEPEDVVVTDAFLGKGYGVVGDLEREAIKLAAQTEGLLVDPVYTGRALGGLISMIRDGEILANQRVLFWHTGGTPALFAYTQDIVE